MYRKHICAKYYKSIINSYHRYVDDIVYNTTKTNITSTLQAEILKPITKKT
jgi:hypothetical protein